MKLRGITKLSFNKPRKAHVVIFDSYSERHFRPIFQDLQPLVFDVSLPKVNVWILLTSLKFGFPSLRNYLCAFIKRSRASLVVTTIDNSPIIYQVKNDLPNVKILVVQNGRRSTFGKSPFTSFTDELKRQQRIRPNVVDYYFTFGSTEQVQFEPYISARFIPIGNFKNNYLTSEDAPESSNVLTYISSYPNFDDNSSGTVDSDDPYLFFEDQPISYRQYFQAEVVVARWLANYCAKNNLSFQIAGKRSSRTPQEEAFFRSQIPGDWRFEACNSESDSYRMLFRSRYVASVDSSLAYEMFGRGKRTLFFTVRGEFTNTPRLLCTKFGYPTLVNESGPMWTNEASENQFERVAQFVTSCTEAEWKAVVEKYSPIVMEFDPFNSLITETVGKCLATHSPDMTQMRSLIAEIYG